MTFARLAALALIAGLAAPMAPAMAQNGPQTGQSPLAPLRSITVEGEGYVRAAPEMARVQLGVSETAPTARAALDAMNAAMARVLDQLTEAGIAPEDVQTGQLSLDRDYARLRDGQTEPEGFVASTLVELRVQDLDSLGTVLDAAVGEGANRLQGIEFMLSDQAAARNEARRAAVADAQARAALYADSAGVTLGEVLSLSESNISSGRQPLMNMRMAAADSVPIAQGEVEISSGVTLVFAID